MLYEDCFSFVQLTYKNKKADPQYYEVVNDKCPNNVTFNIKMSCTWIVFCKTRLKNEFNGVVASFFDPVQYRYTLNEAKRKLNIKS